MFRKASVTVVLILLYGCNVVLAQQTIVKGTVTDAKTHDALPFVTVFLQGTGIGTATDEKGNYQLQTDERNISELNISYVGYNAVTVKIRAGITQTVNIQLKESTKQLKEIIVKPGKSPKYRNKDNPAVELIRQVVAHREENRSSKAAYLSYEKYEKIQFSLSNTPEKLRKNVLVRKYDFIASGLDTTTLEGKALLPILLEESLADHYYRQTPEKNRTIVQAEQKVNFDPGLIDNNGISTYMKHVYQDIDIYENDINILTNRFLSPIANVSPTFYKFYIVDTVYESGNRFVQLAFGPRNTGDFLFQGNMHIALDDNYAVRSVNLKVSKNINLNWVRSLHVHQDYERSTDSTYHLTKSELAAEFGITKNGSSGIFGQRTVSIRNYDATHTLPDSLFDGPEVTYAKQAKAKDGTYWESSRHDSLSRAEQLVYANIDSLQNTASFKRIMNIAMLLFAGYSKAGPYVEIGPVNTFYSFNPVEGFRLRLGGRTTPELSKRVYLETYAAYGFKDEKWKYYIGGIYSFHNRSIYEFPVSTLRANFQRDVKIPGQELQFVQEDNILLSLKRGVNDKYLYNDIYNVNYLQEFHNHFSISLGYKNWKQASAGGLHYTSDVTGLRVKDITTSELSLELRWAPKEEFYQGKLYRLPMPNRYPILTVRAIAGIKGLLGGQYDYQKLILNLYKRVYISQFGYTDAVLEGGYVKGQVPYPLLNIHRANQTYSYQIQSYNLMNFLEFISDHYASVHLDHCFNGFFLNKIPLVKKLKFREFISVKVLYGGLRDENRPNGTKELLQFATDPNGNVTTGTLQSKPYVEGSIGVGNILKFFRIDVVRRFTYLDNPNVSSVGIRGRFKFDF